MRLFPYRLLPASTALAMLLAAGCGGGYGTPMPPAAPTPAPNPAVTANAYILPGASSLGAFAFGDEPIVIYKGENLRWVNADALAHRIAADSPEATDFRGTDELSGGGQQSFTMNKLGTTKIHCTIHPSMTGTLIVREH